MADYKKVRDFTTEVGMLDAKLQGVTADYYNRKINQDDYSRELKKLLGESPDKRTDVQQWILDKNADAKNRELNRIATTDNVIPHYDSAVGDQAYHNANVMFGTRNEDSLWGQLYGMVDPTHPDLPMYIAGRTTSTPWHEGLHRLIAEKAQAREEEGKDPAVLVDLKGNEMTSDKDEELIARAIDYLRAGLTEDGKLSEKSRKWAERKGYIKPWNKDFSASEELRAMGISFIDQMLKNDTIDKQYVDSKVIREAVDKLDEEATPFLDKLFGNEPTVATKTTAKMQYPNKFNKYNEGLLTLLQALPLSYNTEYQEDQAGYNGIDTDWMTIDLDRTGFEPTIK